MSCVGQHLWGSPRSAGSNSVSQVDRVSDIALAATSVVGRFRKGKMTSALLDARHFTFSLCTTLACQAASLVLKLRGSESE